ncbi:MAG: BlaI/MecI/CopY family transcriptional regulator [Acidobacteriota bacterium]|jgi:BlaI family penicillinase repressor|nr:BlaI/MecI/CopY family transcriptional regulator [Acidobacteriota bacterium]
MRQSGKISEAEWQVCHELWRHSPQTANEITRLLADSNGWSPRTVRTLINRLVKKNVLGYESQGREYRYFPLIGKDECVAAYTQSFVERVFNGAAGTLVATFIKHRKLSAREIAELKAILDGEAPDGSEGKSGKPAQRNHGGGISGGILL